MPARKTSALRSLSAGIVSASKPAASIAAAAWPDQPRGEPFGLSFGGGAQRNPGCDRHLKRPGLRGARHRAALRADPLAPSGGYASLPRPKDLRVTAELLSRINLIPPVQSHFQKYFCSRLTQIKSISLAVPPPEGRIAIVTDAGRDAVDAAALGARRDGRAGSLCARERSNGELTNGACADGEVVWS